MKKNRHKYNITYEILNQFITEIQDTTEYLNVARKYTNDVSGLILNLQLHGHLGDRSSKTRFTKLINHIKDQLSEETVNLTSQKTQ